MEQFTTIPCEPHTAHKVQGKSYFYNIRPCANDISTLTFSWALFMFLDLKIKGKCTSRHLFSLEIDDIQETIFSCDFFRVCFEEVFFAFSKFLVVQLSSFIRAEAIENLGTKKIERLKFGIFGCFPRNTARKGL